MTQTDLIKLSERVALKWKGIEPIDVCPKCGGSFIKTGGFPVGKNISDTDYHCQACECEIYFNAQKGSEECG